jgi:hypothetical protein
MERNSLTFVNTRWEETNVQQLIWQGNLDFTEIKWEKVVKVAERAFYMYNEVLDKLQCHVGSQSSTSKVDVTPHLCLM